MTTPQADPNPYVGPKPFERGQTLFGRDRERRELRYLLTSERIVLLYSPSGAGKSSLVNAGLLPEMEKRFSILGPVRVNLQPKPGVRNRYVWSCIAELEKSEQAEERSLLEYFEYRKHDRNPLVIFDQFEEILRVDPTDIDQKKEFFKQLGELLLDPSIWALFIIREDYLAPLDPYAKLLPTHLENRYRIDRLNRAEAENAIVLPTRTLNRKFAEGVVSTLVSNLAKVTVQNLEGKLEEVVGEYVEPVHLQVVCFDLWNQMDPQDLSIDPADVGDVGQALSRYYAKAVLDASTKDIATERCIRQWFDEQLITSDGVRNQVRMEETRSGGLPNALVKKMTECYLVRREERGGIIWFELAHDRLVRPIRANNQDWFEQHLTKLQQRAAQWRRANEAEGLLLLGDDLKLALDEAEERRKSNTLTPAEEDFLLESSKVDGLRRREAAMISERLERDRKAKRVLLSLLAVMAVLLGFAIQQYLKVEQAVKEAKAAATKAESAEKTAGTAVAKYDLATIQALDSQGKTAQAMAYLSRALKAIGDSADLEAMAAPAVEKFLTRGGFRVPFQEIVVDSPVADLSWSGNGARLLTIHAGAAQVWDASTAKPVGPKFSAAPSLRLNLDGKLAVARQALIDPETGKEPGERFLPGNTEFAEFLNADSKRRLFTASLREARVWDLDSRQALGRSDFDAFRSIGINADRTSAWVVLNQRVGKWKFSTLPSGTLEWVSFGSTISAAALGPKGERVAAIVNGGAKAMVSSSNGANLTELRNIEGADQIAFTRDGKYVVLSAGKASPAWIGLWDAATAAPGPRWTAAPNSTIRFKPAWPVFVEVAPESIQVRNILNGEPVAQVVTRGPVAAWSLSIDGQRLAAVTMGGKHVELWDVTAAKAASPNLSSKGLSPSDAEALSLLASAAGGMIVEGSTDPKPLDRAARLDLCQRLKSQAGLSPAIQALADAFLSKR